MIKYLAEVEFRYHDKSTGEYDSGHRSKTVTIGVFDTFDEAASKGNEMLEVLESSFKLNPHWNKRERFSKNGGCFGSPKNLITNLAYLQTPFEFYARIITLKHDDISQTIKEVLESIDRYKEYKSLNED